MMKDSKAVREVRLFQSFRGRLGKLIDVKRSEKRLKDEPLELSSKEVFAAILAAYLVFAPIILILVAISFGLQLLAGS